MTHRHLSPPFRPFKRAESDGEGKNVETAQLSIPSTLPFFPSPSELQPEEEMSERERQSITLSLIPVLSNQRIQTEKERTGNSTITRR